MNIRSTALFALGLICIAPTVSLAQSSPKYQWKLESTDKGCHTYTSTVESKRYIAAKAVCVVPARIDIVGTVLRDIASFPNWMEDCSASKVLRVVDRQRDVFVFWFRQHVPLFSDRDMVLKTETRLRPGWASIRVYSTDEINYDAGAGYVRMPSFASEFVLEWVDREHTKVAFMIDPDLGDGLPTVISNSIIRDTPLKSLRGMTRMVKQEKYIRSAKGSSYEKAVLEGLANGTLK